MPEEKKRIPVVWLVAATTLSEAMVAVVINYLTSGFTWLILVAAVIGVVLVMAIRFIDRLNQDDRLQLPRRLSRTNIYRLLGVGSLLMFGVFGVGVALLSRFDDGAATQPGFALVDVGEERRYGAGLMQFSVPSRWSAEVIPEDGERCSFRLESPDRPDWHQFLDAYRTVVHGRVGGSYSATIPPRCEIVVRGSDVTTATLPLEVGKSSQGGATGVFSVSGAFKVSINDSYHCGATVYRDLDGEKVPAYVNRGQERLFSDSGSFWVETSTYDCHLKIDPVEP